jgi:hypothetical protein
MTLADDDVIPVHPLVPILVRDPVLLSVSIDATFAIRRDISKGIVQHIRKQDDTHKERRGVRVKMTKAKTNLKLRSLPIMVILMLTTVLFNRQGFLC